MMASRALSVLCRAFHESVVHALLERLGIVFEIALLEVAAHGEADGVIHFGFFVFERLWVLRQQTGPKPAAEINVTAMTFMFMAG